MSARGVELPGECPYCGAAAELVLGLEVYPRLPELAGRSYWRCAPCDALVGCHKGTTQPLGTLAKRGLRRARMQAHAAFDRLWKGRPWLRSASYSWLAGQLGIHVADCHMGSFNEAQCAAVVAAVAGAEQPPPSSVAETNAYVRKEQRP